MTCEKVRSPLQCSRIALLVPCSLMAPSGKRTVASSAVAAPQRTPLASLGWLESVGTGNSGHLDSECAGRWPPGLDIGEIEGIELGPKDVAFIAQGLDSFLLFGACVRVVVNVIDGECRVFRRLMQAGFEI